MIPIKELKLALNKYDKVNSNQSKNRYNGILKFIFDSSNKYLNIQFTIDQSI
jgi:hypothetical protein